MKKKRVKISLSDEEIAQLENLATKYGITKSMAVSRLLEMLKNGRLRQPVDVRQLLKISKQLQDLINGVNRVGVNVNQVAYAVNSAKLHGKLDNMEAESLKSRYGSSLFYNDFEQMRKLNEIIKEVRAYVGDQRQ